MFNFEQLREKILSWWQNDPKAKQKLGLTLVVVVFTVALFANVVFSFIGSRPPSSPTSSASSVPASRATLEDSSDVERMTEIEASGLNSFLPSGSDNIYLNADLKLVINNEEVRGSPSFIAVSMFNQNTRVIINEINGTTIYSKADNSFSKLASPVANLTPAGNNRFVLAYQNNRSFVIRSINNINAPDQAQTLDTIRPNLNVSSSRTVIFNNRLYFLFWQNPNQTGTMEIWRLEDNNRAILLDNIANTDLTRVTQNGLIISTQTAGTRLDYLVVDYRQDANGQKTDFSRLIQNNPVFGELRPSQCGLYIDRSLLCLVPESQTIGLYKLVSINYENGSLSDVLPGAVFNGSTLNLIDGQAYLFSRDNFVYRVRSLGGR